MTKLTKSKQQGATLVVVLMLLLIMMLLALSIASSTTSRTLIANASVLKAQSFQAAETGSDVLLTLLNEKQGALTIPTCNNAYNSQYHINEGKETAIASTTDDLRGVTLSWYACKPDDGKGNEIKPTCSSTDVVDCFAVVITGVACFTGGDITGSEEERRGCTVSRHLQGYAVKK